MKYYTIKEVAERSGKSQKTVRRYIASNVLKSEKVSNKYRIYEDSFNEWMKSLENLEKNDVICAFGNMFWVKTQACKSILEMNFKIDDFPIEPLDKCDGLLTHSIERIMPSLVQRDGFFTSYVIPDIEASMYINTLMDSIKKLKRSM